MDSKEEYFEVLQKEFDKAFRPNGETGEIIITATELKSKNLYNRIKLSRESLGLATEQSIEKFIHSVLRGYKYTGYPTTQAQSKLRKNALKRVKVELDTYTQPPKQ